MSAPRIVTLQEGFVLHTWPYRETSLVVEALSRASGRITLVAKGARRPRSPVRGTLMAFQPLALSWFGKGEMKTLVQAEWQGGQPLLRGESLLCGFYLNELLVRLLAREDPHESLFERYRAVLRQLAAGEPSAPILRAFEKALLRELGYALTLDRDAASGGPIDPGAFYTYDPERGPLPVDSGNRGDGGADDRHAAVRQTADIHISGRTLLDIANDDFADPQTLAQAKGLMRTLINHRLDFQPLNSRRIFRELLEL
jgi:DNA repair protein RecO (recombination protein O)